MSTTSSFAPQDSKAPTVSPDGGAGTCTTLYYNGLKAVGATLVRRQLQRTGPILCYHNVAPDSSTPGGDRSLHIPAARFERQVRWLAAHYRIAPLLEIVEACRAGRALRRTAAITFDDAYQGVFDHAVPILQTLGLPATIFVVSSAPGTTRDFWWDDARIAAHMTPERRRECLTVLRGDGRMILEETGVGSRQAPPATHPPANWATIAAHAGNGIDLGVHSATHRALPALTDTELQEEVVWSRAVLHRETGIWPRLFAYPYGLSDARTEGAVRDAGYLAAFGLDPRRGWRRADDLWHLGRLNIPSSISDTAFEAWATGFISRAVQ